MPRSTPLPSDLPRHFSVAQARALGVGYGRTRGADLDRPFHGIRSTAGQSAGGFTEDRMLLQARRYAPRLRAGQFFCATTALAIHGIPIPESRGELVVHVASPRNPPRARGVRGHQLAVAWKYVDGLPTCAAVDAWVQAASMMSLDDAIVSGDALVHRKRPAATLVSLHAAVSSARGARGVRTLVAALPLVRERTDSPRETVLRLLIVRAGLPEPVVNAAITHDGEFLGYGDLVYPAQRILIEYEGEYNFRSDAQAFADIERLARFVKAGWRVIRVHNRHLAAPDRILADIRHALES